MSEGAPHREAAVADRSRPRTAGLRAFLERELRDPAVRVVAAGPEREIAVLCVPASLLPWVLERRLREAIVRRAREEGYRYAAVDLPGGEE